MNLQVPPQVTRRSRGPINREALRSLQQTSTYWKSDIERFAHQVSRRPSTLDSAKDTISVNGRSLSSYFDAAKLVSLMSTLKFAVEKIPEFESLLEDVIGILTLLAAMSTEFVHWLTGNDAENAWKNLVKDAGLLVEKAGDSYQRHQEIYDSIFSMLCDLLPPGYGFWIKLAATLLVRVWPHRHSIAKWVASNWKQIAVGVGIVAAIIGIGALALGAFAGYKSQSKSKSDDEK